MKPRILFVAGWLAWSAYSASSQAELKTWDGRYSIDRIAVTVVYFVPRDRTPLPDWRERVDYFRRRIEQFHRREFAGQSDLVTHAPDEPFRSERTVEDLREGDANAIFFRTLREVDERLRFGTGERTAFPILLVLSDINWRPLEDFYRLSTQEDGQVKFEGNMSGDRHFPGAASGGARATYLANRGVGWGLVSADGWRVPYCGSDCVVYHEGVGHAIGLPHPEPADRSVMSLGQYHGWISESWVEGQQKLRLGFQPPEATAKKSDLFSVFRAVPEPLVPKPGENAFLKFEWPPMADVRTCRVRLQTNLLGPWRDVPINKNEIPRRVSIGSFDGPTPVSYRIDGELAGGERVELWGYFQVRSKPSEPPLPPAAGE